ncbi:MAG: DegT/DnrJ/EryC1/StrS aminotransferase [Idiomarina sp. T82-3]|uniref:DegT/DnrJ/EryC1/StrS family aminotransferase n=1 Tax=Idiomarina TaxID=135575 RepID=UPI000798ED23|nr:DegT/DnrJ/EryC1/StrS family aminotransferase [Idiomarina sp. T82-3]KXS35320.1 MAG: DegT/DnrJ/EryC1/StrS aminotransferase [Idiomarina sp. T82-3]
MIPVTKPYLPSREKLERYIDGIYKRQWLTNSGPLAQELTQRLSDYLGVEHLLLVSNGTLALQIAYRVLGVTEAVNDKPAEAITTPFTFVATGSSLKWEGIKPIFADIDPESWCLDPANIESLITEQTRAIVPVHVFGNACDVETIDRISQKYKLKVIYDAAHAFGINYKGKSLLNWGDAATLSFHATKVFHCVEGGAIVFKRREDLERAKRVVNFGIAGADSITELGINAKMNEFQAAMGLCVLDEIERINRQRQSIVENYQSVLGGYFLTARQHPEATTNGAYFPIVFDSESALLIAKCELEEQGIFPRRYFYPSLNNLDILGKSVDTPISVALASRILCLPLYCGVNSEVVSKAVKEFGSEVRVFNVSKETDINLAEFIYTINSKFSFISDQVELDTFIEMIKKESHILVAYDAMESVVGLLTFDFNSVKHKQCFISCLAVRTQSERVDIASVLINRACLMACLNCIELLNLDEVSCENYIDGGYYIRKNWLNSLHVKNSCPNN